MARQGGAIVFGAALIATCWASRAQALSAEVPTREPSLVGAAFKFRVTTTDAVGVAQYRWNFGDDTTTEFAPGVTEIEHTYAQPGHYPIIVTIKDDGGGLTSVAFVHTVHYPVFPERATTSTDLVYDPMRKRVYVVNQDDDTISSVDAAGMAKIAEVPVYQHPEALAIAKDGKLWVLHRDDYAIAVVDLDRFEIERGFRLPYVSQPMGLAMSPSGDAVYVTLLALGKLLKLDPVTGNILGELEVGPRARGVAVSHDGKDVYVTRFISSDAGGEVVNVDGPALKVKKRFQLAPDTTTMDSDQSGRGLPNYLFSVGLSPDGRQAWIPGKKDNIFRGALRDKQALGQDNTVRPMVAVIDLLQGAEALERRIDLDDRNLPSHVEWSPLGDYAFVALTGSGLIEVRDGYSGAFVTAMKEAGIAPRGVALTPDNRLFVHGSLTRNVVVFDVADILGSVDQTTKKIADIGVVAEEKLTPDVLRGKQIFYNSADGRMTFEGYLSCASCHFDGFEDGRVWDFTSRGEGLRNTTSLLGRRGLGQGNVHWSANFDEIQDFDIEIRGLFGGTGFLPNDLLDAGTSDDPLGDKKAGQSPELDALAAYVTTLDHVNPSPFRNPDGSMTADALAGREIFTKLGCDFCHVGPDFTDSSRGMLHDVGTLKPSSGKRSGGPLLGIDTPTLLGIWETAPYLHDGSAATLRDVLTTANPNDQHSYISTRTPKEIDQLVAYLLQIDNELPPRRLPFEPPLPETGDAGPPDADEGGTGIEPPPGDDRGARPLCTCELPGGRTRSAAAHLWILAPLFLWSWRRRNGGTFRETPR
jgi:YVTN family beta-propeller protein